MKKNFLFLVLLLSGLVFFSSCESRSGRRARELKLFPQDTIIFSPEKIGVTEMEREFIPYPKYDGGTGMWISYYIGIEYQGKTYQIDLRANKFFRDNIKEEEAKNEPEIQKLISTHYLITNTPKNYLEVTVINSEVEKIIRMAKFWPDGSFSPEKIIWKK